MNKREDISLGFIFTPTLHRVYLIQNKNSKELKGITVLNKEGERFLPAFKRGVRESFRLDIVRECPDIAVIESEDYRVRVHVYQLTKHERLFQNLDKNLRSIPLKDLHKYPLGENLELLIPYSKAYLKGKLGLSDKITNILIFKK